MSTTSKKLALLFCISALVNSVLGQGTAFTYQGQLADNGAPANGNYDLLFSLYNANSGGSQVGATLTNTAIAVSNGLFTATLDFGSGTFNGNSRWLEIAVQTNGGSGFTTLTPRQPVTPAPYATLAANAVSSATLTGPVPNASLSGSYTAPVAINNPANAIGGNFSGNAIGLTNLNASQLNTGSVPDARLSANVALLNNNQTFSGSNVFNNQVQFGANAIHILGTASSTMAMLGNGNWFPGPVPYFRPAFPNSQSPMDVMPNGSTVTNRGSAWIDVCSSDITLDSGNWEAVTLALNPSYASVSTKQSGIGQIRSLALNEFGGNVGIGIVNPEASLHVKSTDPVPVYITSSSAPGIMFNNQTNHTHSTAYAYIGVATAAGHYLDQAVFNDLCIDASSRLLLGTAGGIGGIGPAGVTQIIISTNMVIVTNVVAYIQTNAAPFTIDNDDIAINRVYTNGAQRLSLVAAVGLTAGAGVALYVDQNADGTWDTRIPVVTSAAFSCTNIVSGWIQPGAIYCITNLSSMGSAIVSRSCQRVWQ